MGNHQMENFNASLWAVEKNSLLRQAQDVMWKILIKKSTFLVSYATTYRRILLHMPNTWKTPTRLLQVTLNPSFAWHFQFIICFTILWRFVFLILAEMKKCKRVPISNDGQDFLLLFGNGTTKCVCDGNCGKVFSARSSAMRHVKKEHKNVQGTPQEEEDEQ